MKTKYKLGQRVTATYKNDILIDRMIIKIILDIRSGITYVIQTNGLRENAYWDEDMLTPSR